MDGLLPRGTDLLAKACTSRRARARRFCSNRLRGANDVEGLLAAARGAGRDGGQSFVAESSHPRSKAHAALTLLHVSWFHPAPAFHLASALQVPTRPERPRHPFDVSPDMSIAPQPPAPRASSPSASVPSAPD